MIRFVPIATSHSAERMEFPEPVISVAVEPQTKADQEKMGVALGKLAQEDPSFRVKTDEESGQTIISGMGELHLDILVDRMRREFTVEANIGKPQVAYRERFANTARLKVSLFASRVAAVSMVMSVLGLNRRRSGAEGLEFVNEVVGGSVPREYIPAVCQRYCRADAKRCSSRLSLVGCKATLYDGSFHDVDSSEMAFKIAGFTGHSRS